MTSRLINTALGVRKHLRIGTAVLKPDEAKKSPETRERRGALITGVDEGGGGTENCPNGYRVQALLPAWAREKT